ncbi:MAG: ABC transporter substrate-binding protein [Azospirillaceae bacterium]|nr:ABC transporter substrate-binding protein [Azospirillaceae bacterium]
MLIVLNAWGQRLAALVLLILLTAAPALQAETVPPAVVAPPTVVRIGWLRAPNDITLAKAHGSLEAALQPHNARVEWVGPFAAAAPAQEAINAGSIDITAGSSTAAVSALAAHIPMVVFAYQKMAPGAEAILVKQDSPIHSLKDLIGRRVAVNRGGTGEYLLVRALEMQGIDPASVTRRYLSPADSGSAFDQGHVDAWATWDPFVAMAVHAYGARVLADGAAIGSENAVVLIAHRDFATGQRALLQVIFETLIAENTWSQSHQAEAGAIWTGEMAIPETLAAEIGAHNAVPTRAVTAADQAQIADIADWSLANHIVPTLPDVAAGVITLP